MDTPQGVALTISPDPGTTAKHNDEVTVTLSKGPMPVTMPNIRSVRPRMRCKPRSAS